MVSDTTHSIRSGVVLQQGGCNTFVRQKQRKADTALRLPEGKERNSRVLNRFIRGRVEPIRESSNTSPIRRQRAHTTTTENKLPGPQSSELKHYGWLRQGCMSKPKFANSLDRSATPNAEPTACYIPGTAVDCRHANHQRGCTQDEPDGNDESHPHQVD